MTLPTFTEVYHVYPKDQWGVGPWQDEPDKTVWIDDATGFDCMAVRSPLTGSLCGYVGLPEGHPFWGMDPDELPVSAHGGLTYSGECQEGDPETTVCHVPKAGRPDKVYWLGFDCAHFDDVMPAMLIYSVASFGTYKNLHYVVSEVQDLAAQLSQLKA